MGNAKVMAVGVLLILAVVFGPRLVDLSPLGGSTWQFDYVLSSITVNGVVVGASTLPNGVDNSNADGTRDTPIVSLWGVEVVFADAYSIIYDVDGPPRYTGYEWLGLLPTVSVSMSLPWRVNANGLKIGYQDIDLLQVTHELADGSTQYEYYYQFTVHAETNAATFLVPPTLQSGFQAWSSAECGDYAITASILVIMQDSIFGQTTGEFADAQVTAYEVIDLAALFNPWLEWAIEPKVEPGATGTAIGIQDRQAAADAYTCVLAVPFSMSSGLLEDGDNLLPYDVWITKTIQTTILLTEPLDIGATGTGQEGGQPPEPDPPFDWRMVLIVIFVAVILLAALYIVLNRKRGGRRK